MKTEQIDAGQMNTIKIYTHNKQQVIDGWGTSLCWWANAAGGWTMQGENGEERREELMRLFFSEEGLALNIVRYNIGGGDNPGEARHMFHARGIPCYQSSPEQGFDVDADSRQLWVLKRAYEIRNGNLIKEAFVNSPPWWMTKSLCSSGNEELSQENLEPSRYEEFAEFCADALAFLDTDKKSEMDYFVPMNEPASDYWAKGQRQEGNKVNSGESQSRLLTAVFDKLKERKLSAAITGTDETNPAAAVESYRLLDSEVKNTILEKINYHHYARDRDALEALKEIAYPEGFAEPKYKLWMDEVCFGDGEDHMELAQNLITLIDQDLNVAHANGWVIWQAMDTMSENIQNKCHWGLVEGMYQDKDDNELNGILDVKDMGFDEGDYVITAQYYVMGHYSKYIKKGYSITENDGKQYYCVSAVSPDGKTAVVILYNESDAGKTISVELQDFAPQKIHMLMSNDNIKWKKEELPLHQNRIRLEGKTIVTLLYES